MKEKPAPQILWSWRLAVVTACLPLTGLIVWLGWLFLPTYLSLMLALWGGCLLFVLGIYLPLRRRSVTFALEPNEITVTGGVLITTTRRMRTDAVRQVTLLQGPLERRLGIAFLLISATGGYLLIEGIDRTRAEDWCKRLGRL